MKKVIQVIFVLTMVGLISGASLVFVYKYASPLIAKNQEKETKEAIFKVFLDASFYEKIDKDDEEIFLIKDKSNKLIGYAFIAEGNGYQGKIRIMAGIENDLITLAGIEVLESQETPGLGQEIIQGKFKKQFVNLRSTPPICCIKEEKQREMNEIHAITGATISSKAVVSILNEKIAKIRKSLKQN